MSSSNIHGYPGIHNYGSSFTKKQFQDLPELTVRVHIFGFESHFQKLIVSLFFLQYIAALPFAIAAVLSDIIVAGSLCYLLQNRKTPFRSCVFIIIIPAFSPGHT